MPFDVGGHRLSLSASEGPNLFFTIGACMIQPQSSATVAGIRREFLGWDLPALPQAARRLAARYRQGSTLDLAQVIVVVPGQRAGRRLLELLAFLAEDEHLRLTPPVVVTEGLLPEKLYTPKLPFANDLVQDLVWAESLRALPAATLRHVMPHPPAPDDTLGWLELAKVFRTVHRELAADGLDFAAVQKRGPNLAHFNEGKRWGALTTMQLRYHQLLDQQLLWDKQTARLKAIEFREIKSAADLILLGTVDLNDTLRQMLDQIAERVTAYVVAPAELADHFDDHGCLVPERWREAVLPLRDEQLHQVDGAEEQAGAVSAWLAEISGRYRTDEVVIGVPDEALVPQLQRELEQCGVPARWVEGVRLGQSPPYRLLQAAVAFASQRRYDDLAALVRHPDLADWLRRVAGGNDILCEDGKAREGRGRSVPLSLPAQLDQFYNDRLPSRMPASQGLPRDADWPDLPPALEQIDRWLADASDEQSLRTWAEIFRKLLSAIYGERVLNLDAPADDVLLRTLHKTLNACAVLEDVPAALDTVRLAAADAFLIVFGPLGDEYLPPPADPDAVEILGWLELPLDDAPALLVTSFNEGFVPKSAGADAFLPDRLRRELNLLHNERRYARDAYATSVLSHSRTELRVIFARRDTGNDPLHPSRLLFACSDATLVARARHYFAEHKAATAPRRLLLAPQGPIPAVSGFDVPRPVDWDKNLQQISVTSFRTYLSCPYRYYLRQVRRLKVVDDAARELDGGAFGTLLHRVLGAFGRAPEELRSSRHAPEIAAFLVAQLTVEAEAMYGAQARRPALRLQLEQARRRLLAFATRQAELAREGWRILHAEDEGAQNLAVDFGVNGSAIKLVGSIDRVDVHEQRRLLRIVDYKTADTPKTPEQTHRQREAWIDLQLPLYGHLWHGLGLQVPANLTVELGYFNLPKQLDQSDVVLAEWDPATLADAETKAREIIERLRGEEPYWPPVYDPIPDFAEDFACICLDNVRSRPVLGDDEDGGTA